jgi:hypothetical protein
VTQIFSHPSIFSALKNKYRNLLTFTIVFSSHLMIENLQNHFIFKKKLTSFFGKISAIKKGLDTIEGIALLRYSRLKINQSKGGTVTAHKSHYSWVYVTQQRPLHHTVETCYDSVVGDLQ